MAKTQMLSEKIRIAILRDERSVAEIARAAGLNQPTVHRFASGQRDLTGDLLSRLLPVLGFLVVSPDERVTPPMFPKRKPAKKARKTRG